MDNTDFIFILLGVFVIIAGLNMLFRKDFRLMKFDEKTVKKLSNDDKLRRKVSIPIIVSGVVLIVPSFITQYKILTIVIIAVTCIWFCITEITILKKIKNED